jgi:aspartyl aminopeptidase
MYTVDTQDFISFLGESPTPFHATARMVERLHAAGFTKLDETAAWDIRSNERYFVVRNDSSLIAWQTGASDPAEQGIHLVGTHTDSPCLKIKPQPELHRHSYGQLGVEVYGGVLLHPWFDRDLSLAGRVHYRKQDGSLASTLINFRKAVAVIPSLAIHLDREANNGRALNAQKELPPVLFQYPTHDHGKIHFDFRETLLKHLNIEKPDSNAIAVLDYEISLYDTATPACIGLHDEFIASARLDNLLSCYSGLQALLTAHPDHHNLLVCTDHEEVGSVSSCGAQGSFLRAVLERWLVSHERYERTIARSMMVSADNAHGVHPNYSDKHDEKHSPLLNHGPAIKVNANQRYASNSATQAVLRDLAQRHNIPLQTFVARSDMGCGSTIGPLTSAEVGVKTIDIGVPTFAMHSIRELAGMQDVQHLTRLLSAFFNSVPFTP